MQTYGIRVTDIYDKVIYDDTNRANDINNLRLNLYKKFLSGPRKYKGHLVESVYISKNNRIIGVLCLGIYDRLEWISLSNSTTYSVSKYTGALGDVLDSME